MDTLYQQIVGGIPAALAQDMFLVHIFLFLTALSLVALLSGLFVAVKGKKWTDEASGTFFAGLIAAIFFFIFASINYYETIELREAPEHWAAHKMAQTIEKALE